MLILAGAGIAYLANAEDEYISAGQVKVQGESTTTRLGGLGGDQSIWTTPAETTEVEFAELFASESFLRAIIAGTEWEQELANPEVDLNQLYGFVREDVWTVTIGDNTIGIVAKSPNPATAKLLVENTVSTFLNWKTQTDLVDASSSVEFFTEQELQDRGRYESAENELRQFLVDFPEPVRGDRPEVEELEIKRLESVRDDFAARLNESRDKLSASQLNYRNAETGTQQQYLVIDQPRLPDDSETSLTGQIVTLAIFMTVGGIMGLLGVFGGALLDRTFRYPVDIRESLELPVLGVVPFGTNVDAQPMPAYANASQAAAPPPVYRTKLTPNVEPPTLIIMPGEKAELEKIAQERNQHAGEVRLAPA